MVGPKFRVGRVSSNVVPKTGHETPEILRQVLGPIPRSGGLSPQSSAPSLRAPGLKRVTRHTQVPGVILASRKDKGCRFSHGNTHRVILYPVLVVALYNYFAYFGIDTQKDMGLHFIPTGKMTPGRVIVCTPNKLNTEVR